MPALRAGDLDRRIVIERPTNEQGAAGGVDPTWSTFAEVWAQKEPLLGRKYFAAQQVNAQVDTIFRIRWIDGVDQTMRLIEKSTGLVFDIMSVQEIGRQDGYEIMAQVHRVP